MRTLPTPCGILFPGITLQNGDQPQTKIWVTFLTTDLKGKFNGISMPILFVNSQDIFMTVGLSDKEGANMFLFFITLHVKQTKMKVML